MNAGFDGHLLRAEALAESLRTGSGTAALAKPTSNLFRDRRGDARRPRERTERSLLGRGRKRGVLGSGEHLAQALPGQRLLLAGRNGDDERPEVRIGGVRTAGQGSGGGDQPLRADGAAGIDAASPAFVSAGFAAAGAACFDGFISTTSALRFSWTGLKPCATERYVQSSVAQAFRPVASSLNHCTVGIANLRRRPELLLEGLANGRPVADCNDDGIACPDAGSEVVAEVVQGACYLLRVGSFPGQTGSGTIVLAGAAPTTFAPATAGGTLTLPALVIRNGVRRVTVPTVLQAVSTLIEPTGTLSVQTSALTVNTGGFTVNGTLEVAAALGREVLVDASVDVADGRGERVGPAVASPAQELADAARRQRPRLFHGDRSAAESVGDGLESRAHEVIASEGLREVEEIRIDVAYAAVGGEGPPTLQELRGELHHPRYLVPDVVRLERRLAHEALALPCIALVE